APQPRPGQPAPGRRLYVMRPVWTAPDASPEAEKRPESKKKKARTGEAKDDSEQETPKDEDGAEGRGAQKEAPPEPPA
ncbi:MAG TPA: hypothetical protein VD861_06405, partial [Pyrinomonadaceae bacterium]|nr:hypothetical protein [Pyrinomonadaceae bacterium]